MTTAGLNTGHVTCTGDSCVQLAALVAEVPAHIAKSDARRAELAVAQRLAALGITTLDHPRAVVGTPYGSQMEPDLGLHLGLAGTRTMRSCGSVFDTVGEVRVQGRKGSAEKKLYSSITEYAHAADRYQVPAVIFHHLCPKAITAGYLEWLAPLAWANHVALLPVEGLTRDIVVNTVTEVWRRQQETASDANLQGLAETLDPQLVAAIERLQHRRAVTPR